MKTTVVLEFSTNDKAKMQVFAEEDSSKFTAEYDITQQVCEDIHAAIKAYFKEAQFYDMNLMDVIHEDALLPENIEDVNDLHKSLGFSVRVRFPKK